MKRIAFICANSTAPWGGSELLWSQCADRFVRGGMQVCIARKAWENEATQVTELERLGCQMLWWRDEKLPQRVARKIFPLKPRTTQFIEKVARHQPELVVISQGNSNEGFEPMLRCQELGLRYVTITQAAAEQFWVPDDVATQLAEAFEGAAANYFVSEGNLRLVRRQFATDLPRGKVVRNPFGVPYDSCPAWSGDPTDRLSLACVARLDLVAKGQDLVIDVLSQSQWRRRSVSLTMYGSGMNRACIEAQIKKSALTNIFFGGYVDDVESIWRKHHAMVLASRFEGLPIAMVEAMLCGRPCIATDVAGHAEVIHDGENGFLAAAPTVPLVSEAMERAWSRCGELPAIGKQAADDIRKLVPRDPVGAFIAELEQACA
jgi:glycosyltransferase involved in cell wall biosynthesis